MIIASISENKEFEKRISVTPEVAKKYIELGFEVILSKDYGNHIGFEDQDYKNLGVNIEQNEKEIINKADIVIQLGLISDEFFSEFKENQILIGTLDPYKNKDKLDVLVKKKINLFSLELLPRITRAQSMDILSSQANLAGYKAVIESCANF